MSEEDMITSSEVDVEKILLDFELKVELGGDVTEKQPTWVDRREKLVKQALEDEDRGALERIATLPGGFGTDELRKQAWPVLLRTKWFFPDRRFSQENLADREHMAEGTDGDHNDDVAPVQGPLEELDKPTKHGNRKETPHPDENQVLLDTKRSFVVYPKDLPPQSKLAMQADLQSLIVHVLRLYPTLSYFQGFHDIMSVLYLTFIPLPLPRSPRSRSASVRSRDRSGASTPFSRTMSPANQGRSAPPNEDQTNQSIPVSAVKSFKQTAAGEEPTEIEKSAEHSDRGRPEQPPKLVHTDSTDRNTLAWTVLRRCAEVVSTCRVRDAMGHGMEPMMGLLKLLQRLLKAADPELSKFSASISPVPTLPFFALSWILCLFSHDIDTLEPVQRMFDFLLSRNPISAIYLAVAILMAKKDQMFRLAKQKGGDAEDDPSLLHPLFARLPPLFADTPHQPSAPVSEEKVGSDNFDEPNPYDPIPISRIFNITDELMARFPWDGPIMRGKEVLGPGSAIRTYENELTMGNGEWSLKAAEAMVDVDMMMSGGTEPDEESEEEDEILPSKKVGRPAIRRGKGSGMTLAVGIAVVGIGIALYGFKAGGSGAGWTVWWAMVVRSWAGKHGLEETVRSWRKVLGNLGRGVRDVM